MVTTDNTVFWNIMLCSVADIKHVSEIRAVPTRKNHGKI